MKELLRQVRDLVPYLLLSSVMVMLVLMGLSKLLPTVKDIEPTAEVILHTTL